MRQYLPFVLLVLALLGMATGRFAWTSVPLSLLCVYLLFATPVLVLKKSLSVSGIFWTGLLFWLWILCTMLCDANQKMIWTHIVRNSAWVGLPFCFGLLQLHREQIRKIVYCFTISLAVVSMFCFVMGAIQICNGASEAVLFYHALLKPFQLHAVFFSVYILFCLLFWMHASNQNHVTRSHRRILLAVCIWLVVCLLLLASKLCITLLLVIVLRFAAMQWKAALRTKIISLALVLLSCVFIFFTPNPVQKRFAEIQFNVQETWHRQSFTSADYLDGLSFRLLQWRWVPQALNEKNAWLCGVGITQSQIILNKQYRQAGLYMGGGTAHNPGYGAFNTHNSFLQILLEHGVIGLCIFLAYLMLLFRNALQQHNSMAASFLIVVLLFCFTDALPGTQAGLMLLLLLPQLLLRLNTYETGSE